jgi:hypothetical protein
MNAAVHPPPEPNGPALHLDADRSFIDDGTRPPFQSVDIEDPREWLFAPPGKYENVQIASTTIPFSAGAPKSIAIRALEDYDTPTGRGLLPILVGYHVFGPPQL